MFIFFYLIKKRVPKFWGIVWLPHSYDLEIEKKKRLYADHYLIENLGYQICFVTEIM